MTATLRKKPVS